MKSRHGFRCFVAGLAAAIPAALGHSAAAGPPVRPTGAGGVERSHAGRLVAGDGDHLQQVIARGEVVSGAYIRWQPVYDIDGSLGSLTAAPHYTPSQISGTTLFLPTGPARVWLEVRYGGWGEGVRVKTIAAHLDGPGLLAGDLRHAVEPCAVHADCEAAFGPAARCGESTYMGPNLCSPGITQSGRDDEMPAAHGGPFTFMPYDFSIPSFRWDAYVLFDPPKSDPGFPVYRGTFVVDVSSDALGNYAVGFLPSFESYMLDEHDNELVITLEEAWISVGDTGPAGALACNDAGGNFGLSCQTCTGGSRDGLPCTGQGDCSGGTCDADHALCPGGSCSIQLAHLKNRFIGFKAPEATAGQNTAIRVRLVDIAGHPNCNGEFRWAAPPETFLEGHPGSPTFKASALEVGAAPSTWRDWNADGLFYLYGEEIIPSSRYEVQIVDQSCEFTLDDPSCYSNPLVVRTGKWGDVASPMAPYTSSVQPDIADVTALVARYGGGAAGSMIKARAKLVPGLIDPAFKVDITVITAGVSAYQGNPYPYPVTSCP